MFIILSCSFPPFRNLNHAIRREQQHHLTCKSTHSLPFQKENNSNKLFLNNCLFKLLCELMSCLLKSERVKWFGKQFSPQWTLALFFSNKLLISLLNSSTQLAVYMWILVMKARGSSTPWEVWENVDTFHHKYFLFYCTFGEHYPS